MRFGHVRVAAVTLLSGGFLTLGVLGSAHAAPVLSQGNAAAAAKVVCQALPSPASPSASPSPSPSPSPSSSPTPSPSSSPTSSPSASGSAAAAAPMATPSSSPAQPASPSSAPTGSAAQTGSSSSSATTTPASPSSAQTGSAAQTGSPSPSATRTPASLDAFVASLDGGSSKGKTSPAAPTELCVSVQGAQSSIKRGQTATYTVQVSTKNGSASDVSVALTVQPSSQKPKFTSGCTKGDGTTSCTVSSVTATRPANLHAQIAVASNATSVTSVTLTATASIASTAKWTPPAAAGTTSVTSAAAAHSSGQASPRAAAPLPPAPLPPLPLGPVPNLNAVASQLIGAGDASGLFPAIKPPATPSASPVAHPHAGRHNADPLISSSPVSAGTPVLPAQVAGLIALGLAIMLTVTRLSRRKRSGARRTDS